MQPNVEFSDAASPEDPVDGPVTFEGEKIVLTKRGRRFEFYCAPGQEAQWLRDLSLRVDDPASGLDWFDAAVLAHHVGRRLRLQLERHRRTTAWRQAS